jgi:hypothetical protein
MPQYALLLAEEKMRFEEFHPDDYLEVGWKDWAEEKFREWIDEETRVSIAEFDRPEGLDEETSFPIHHSPEFKNYYHAFDKVRISLPSSLENFSSAHSHLTLSSVLAAPGRPSGSVRAHPRTVRCTR